MMQEQEQDIHELIKVKREKLRELQEAGKNPYEVNSFEVSDHAQPIKDNYEKFEGKTVTLAGRLMSKRLMGKASFSNLADLSGNIQLYIKRDDIGVEEYKDFKKYDMGDIVGVSGYVFKTKTEEISLHVTKITLLSKSLQVLPEKFHGLKDVDVRYRQRYIDLIMNPEVKETFVNRTLILREVRNYLDSEGFLEVETPVLTTEAGGASARPFTSHYNALDEKVKLRISLELYLKRLIVGGMERVYEIGRVFRNEGLSVRHNPEFTLLEAYQAFTDYYGMMDLCENLIRQVALKVVGSLTITYGDVVIDLSKPFERLTMVAAVKKYVGIDFDEIQGEDEAKNIAKEHGIEFESRHKKGDILNLFFEEYVEDKLDQPTFIMDHPVEISPLAKKRVDNPDYTERFELFITKREMANAFSELNDPIDQRKRFEAQEALRDQGDDEAHSIDEDFLTALEYAMPPTGGIGIGIDRLVMLLTNSQAIRDVLFFPTMKSLGDKGGLKKDEDRSKDAKVKIDLSKVKVEPLFEDMIDFDTFSKSDYRVVKIKDCREVPKSKKLLEFILDDGSGVDRTILSGIREYYKPEDLIGKTAVAIVNLPPRAMMGIDSCGMLISAVYEIEGKEGLNLLLLDDGIPAGAKLY